MTLRFQVDQAQCMREGIDCPRSIVHITVKPEELSQEQRDKFADRMSGIDVRALRVHPDGRVVKSEQLIMAKQPSFKGLMDAVCENAAEIAHWAEAQAIRKSEPVSAQEGTEFFKRMREASTS
jgi:hypothetical protein